MTTCDVPVNAEEVALRPVRVGDAETITAHRHRMFVDAGWPDDERMRAMSAAFRPWVTAKLQANQYFGWLALDRERVVAGIGMMAIDWPPHPRHLEPLRGYLLNVFTEPTYRRRGIARRLVVRAVEEAKERGLHLVTLHATPMGKPLYAELGFAGTNEMQWAMSTHHE